MKYIIDAHFDLLTDVAVRRKNGVLDAFKKILKK